jgi:hypothetical protein
MGPSWSHYFVYRKERFKTTWTFRVCATAALILAVYATRPIWIPAVGHSLACEERVHHSDAILVDNFDQDYLLFERASALHEGGFAPRVLVPQKSRPDGGPTLEQEIVDVMVRIARLRDVERIPVSYEGEPISLNVARQVRAFLLAHRIRSVLIVATGFRAARSVLVYRSVLAQAGVTVACVPVFGIATPTTWTDTWHGIQEVTLQFFKLQYYRFFVLPFRA